MYPTLLNHSFLVQIIIFSLNFTPSFSFVSRKHYPPGPSKNGLYVLSPSSPPSALISERASLSLWRQRLAHLYDRVLRQVIHSSSLPCLPNRSSSNKCMACPMGKSIRSYLPLSNNIFTHPLDSILTDV